MGDTVDFITKFHSLEGNLVGERKKNLHIFLRELASSNDGQIESFFRNLDPQTHLEKLFKVDALIYFKRTSDMLDILKGDNEIYRAKVMKQQWFFASTFKNVDAESLVNEFIPQLSFKDRRKFLNKVLRTMDEKQVDLVFTALYHRYGLLFAKHFLHLCSEDKIKDFLESEEIQLQPNQVIHLFDRNVELFLNYIEYYSRTFSGLYHEQKVINHIALTNLDCVINLHEENKIVLGRLGRRTSKRGFEIMKNHLLENNRRAILNKNVMYRKLGSQFKTYYYDLFPKFYSDLSIHGEFSVLKSIPKNKRWPVFSETFARVFPNHDIKNLNVWHLIQYCPDKNVIRTRALEVYQENKEEKYLKYVEPKLSIPLLKERINVTSDISDRRRLVILLIETCAENQDLVSFEAVLKYICYRHRNEENEFRAAILSVIKNEFNLQELNENHWNYLNEQIKIKRIQKQFYFSSDSTFTEGYLQYLFRNNKDFTSALQEYVEDIVQDNTFYLMNKKDPELMRAILLEILKIIDNFHRSSAMDCKIIDSMITFNELYPQHKIEYSSFTNFNQHVSQLFQRTTDIGYFERNVIEKIILHKIKFPDSLPTINNGAIRQAIFNVAFQPRGGCLLSTVLYSFILKESRNTFENDLLVAYFEQLFDIYSDSSIVHWFLFNEPQTIVKYFPKILSSFSNTITNLNLPLIKYYSHFKFDTQVTDHLKQKLACVAYDKKFYYMEHLKTILHTDEFAQIIVSHFLPEKAKLDLTDEKMMEIYKVQCDIAKILHKVEEPHRMLQIVFKFCIGDYLQSALPSLYGVFYKSPEIKLYSCVEELSKGAVSVNKHAVFLSCDLLSQEFVMNILTNTKHTNISSQKHLFSGALKYFQKNPSETLLNMVIGTMSTIDKNDTEALSSLVEATVPNKFKVPYIEKCWTFYESLEPQGVVVKDYLALIVAHLLRDIHLLKNVSPVFIRNIMDSCLPSKKVHNIMEFAATVLVHRENEQIENFDLVFKIISSKSQAETRSFLELFRRERIDLNFVRLLDQYYHQYLTINENFWAHLYLKFWLIDLAKVSEEKFAEDIVTYLEQVISEYGFFSFSLFQNVFTICLNNETKMDRYKLFQNILNFKTTATTCILILNSMDLPNPRQIEETEIFQRILEIIKNVKESIVSVYYTNYISDHKVSLS